MVQSILLGLIGSATTSKAHVVWQRARGDGRPTASTIFDKQSGPRRVRLRISQRSLWKNGQSACFAISRREASAKLKAPTLLAGMQMTVNPKRCGGFMPRQIL